jgi:hypothetical protein
MVGYVKTDRSPQDGTGLSLLRMKNSSYSGCPQMGETHDRLVDIAPNTTIYTQQTMLTGHQQLVVMQNLDNARSTTAALAQRKWNYRTGLPDLWTDGPEDLKPRTNDSQMHRSRSAPIQCRESTTQISPVASQSTSSSSVQLSPGPG